MLLRIIDDHDNDAVFGFWPRHLDLSGRTRRFDIDRLRCPKRLSFVDQGSQIFRSVANTIDLPVDDDLRLGECSTWAQFQKGWVADLRCVHILLLQDTGILSLSIVECWISKGIFPS